MACALLGPPSSVCGQQLLRLHVDALGMHADRSTAVVGSAIHVTIHLHVREHLSSIDNLVLPDLTNLQILGDERRIAQDSSGTDYLETLTVTGIAPGIAHLTPAHLDAIDARNGRPSRFSSNDLTLRITASTTQPRLFTQRLSRRIGLTIAGVVAALAIVLAVLLGISNARPQRPLPSAAAAAPAAPAPLHPRRTLETALAALRAGRTRDEAIQARAALREFAGARSDETLEALLRRLDGATTPALRVALRLAERAAFIGEARLQSAIDEVITAIERVLVQ